MSALLLFQVALAGIAARPAEASSAASEAVDYALAQVGDPYSWGAEGPDSFDCSGLTYTAYANAGVSIPRTSTSQYASLEHVSKSELQPGDLVFFYSPISHVGMYIGNGRMVNSPSSGGQVEVESVMWDSYAGAARPTG